MIKVLPPQVASQIAAGEVIERPASVVKELIENSIDAQANTININIEGAGKILVEVVDDGIGIPDEQLELAVVRYATSKLQTAEDLTNINTLGFRGEALASIGSVSKLSISSRVVSSDIGWIWTVEGGVSKQKKPIGMSNGTIVRVENLFFNVPARQKFLKRDVTERRFIDTLVTRYAIAYPNIRFTLQQDGRTNLQTSGKGNRREVLSYLYGVEIAKQMITMDFQEGNFRLAGFISPISLHRSNRQEIHFFVNGRPISDPTLTAAAIKAYHTLLMVSRFPMVILLIELPVDQIDVNVHPTKAEVRFSDSGWIFSNIQRIIRRTLIAHTPIEQFDNRLVWQQTANNLSINHSLQNYQKMSGGSEVVDTSLTNESADQPQSNGQTSFTSNIPLLRLVGQIALTYLVAEGPDGLYLIDQHAAHERILFEKFINQKKEQIATQILLEPIIVELTPAQTSLLEDKLALLKNLGFMVEPFGKSTFVVRSVPQFISHLDPASALRVLVEDFEEDETPFKDHTENMLIARICKRAAIKAGQTLSKDEQEVLLSGLESCQSPRTCPHGRPTMIHLSVDILERHFGRKGTT